MFFCAPGEVDILGNNQRQTVVVNPDPADVATVDGVTLTGPLILAADPTTNLGAATKHYVDTTSGGGGAPLNSPAFTGVPTAPTASGGTNDTQLATTAYSDSGVFAEFSRALTAEALLRMSVTAVKTANYTLAPSDYVPVNDTGGIVALTLPTTPANATRCGAEYVAGGSHGVVVTAGGSDVFDVAGGSTTATLAIGVLFQSIIWQYSTAGNIWYTLTNNLPLSALDTRYGPLVLPAFSVPTPTTGVAFTPDAFSQCVVLDHLHHLDFHRRHPRSEHRSRAHLDSDGRGPGGRQLRDHRPDQLQGDRHGHHR